MIFFKINTWNNFIENFYIHLFSKVLKALEKILKQILHIQTKYDDQKQIIFLTLHKTESTNTKTQSNLTYTQHQSPNTPNIYITKSHATPDQLSLITTTIVARNKSAFRYDFEAHRETAIFVSFIIPNYSVWAHLLHSTGGRSKIVWAVPAARRWKSDPSLCGRSWGRARRAAFFFVVCALFEFLKGSEFTCVYMYLRFSKVCVN